MNYIEAYLAIGFTIGLWVLYRFARDEDIYKEGQRFIERPSVWIVSLILMPFLWVLFVGFEAVVRVIKYDREKLKEL